jgi:hypothetical protein
MPTKKALISFVKFVFWSGVSGAVAAALKELARLDLPTGLVWVLGGLLKAVATWVATRSRLAEG